MQSDRVLWDKESNLWYNKTALKDRLKLEPLTIEMESVSVKGKTNIRHSSNSDKFSQMEINMPVRQLSQVAIQECTIEKLLWKILQSL